MPRKKKDQSVLIVEQMPKRKVRLAQRYHTGIAAYLLTWVRRHTRAIDSLKESGANRPSHPHHGQWKWRVGVVKAIVEIVNKLDEPFPFDDWADALPLAVDTYYPFDGVADDVVEQTED